MIVRDTGGNFENAPSGTHIARCIRLIGIGTHEQTFEGQTRARNIVIVFWELPHEFRQDGQPFIISKWYTRSLADRATLRKDLAQWRGRDFTSEELQAFDLKNVLDKGCQVIVTENEQGKVNVSSVAGLPKGTTLPDRHNELQYFDVEEWDEGVFQQLSEKTQELIKKSVEHNEINQFGKVLSADERRSGSGTPSVPLVKAAGADDDIPF